MPEIRFTSDGRQIYEPDGLVLVDFLLCRKPVIGIQGPVGSGKSKGANMLVYAIASEQRPDRYGIRRTRWAVVRNTYPELKNTTIRTWLDTFPEEVYGKFRWSIPYQHIIRLDDMVIEVDFLRTTVPDILLTRRYGDTRMTDALRKVTEEYAARAAQLKSEKARVKLEAEKQRVLRDLTAIRDRVRGVYGYSADPGIRKFASVAMRARSPASCRRSPPAC